MEDFRDWSRVWIEAGRLLRYRIRASGDVMDGLAADLNVTLMSEERYEEARVWCTERHGAAAVTATGIVGTSGKVVGHIYTLNRKATWASKPGGNFWFRDEDAAFEFKMAWG